MFPTGFSLFSKLSITRLPLFTVMFVLTLVVKNVGCSTVDEVDVAVRVAAEAKPLDAAAREALVKDAKQFTGKPDQGGVEWYKKPA